MLTPTSLFKPMEERNAENKKFVAILESRHVEKDIESLSKPIDHLTGDALILAQMRRQQIYQKIRTLA
ncbi:hypothetical protein HanIR_Chr10g0462251 [Helianthus annuus]|nr:hypothetical protein HanIR_Chr10g0462251 [Helianthus annuus]